MNKGIGIWEIRDNKVRAKIYSFRTKTKDGMNPPLKELISVVPYEMDVIDMKYIDPLGYSRIPFCRFELPRELRDDVTVTDETHTELLMARRVYSMNIFTPEKYYDYFEIVPDMAKAGLSGIDIVQSPELIKKYLWDLW